MARPTGPYAVLMAGQLSERAGMASPLAGHPVFRRLAGRFDSLTGGRFEGWVTTAPQEEISERFTAPGVMVLYDVVCGEVAQDLWGPPAAVSGYSLGFYAAAVLARCVSAQTILGWLDRVNASNASRFPPGLFAVAVSTGLSAGELEGCFARWNLGGLAVADVNNPRQVVFAGPADEVRTALANLKGVAMDARAVPLDIPLHTPHLEEARREVLEWWSMVPVSAPVIPLISPVTGQPIKSGAAFKNEMLASLTATNDWFSVIRALEAKGIRQVLDLSPKGELGRMGRWTSRDLEVLPVSSLWNDSP